MSPRGTKQEVVVVESEHLHYWERVAKLVKEMSFSVLAMVVLGMVLWLGFGHMGELFQSIDRNLARQYELETRKLKLLEGMFLQQQKNNEALVAILARMEK